MDSPEEVSSPLLHSHTPEFAPDDERPITPELNQRDTDFGVGGGSPPLLVDKSYGDYQPPSPIKLPTFDDDEDDLNNKDDGEEGPSSSNPEKTPRSEKTPARETDFYDLPDNLSDTEEANQGQAQRSGLINDIFGDSEDEEEPQDEKKGEDEDEEGVVESSVADTVGQGETSTQQGEEGSGGQKKDDDDIDTDEELEMLKGNDNLFVSDFDLMMEKKKEERKRYMSRRKKDVTDIINSADDRIIYMISQMKEAAEEDRRLNQAGQAAVNKLGLLKLVIQQLKKHDLQNSFIDCGILPVLADWLTPLPDNSLPHVTIRTEILKILQEYPQINTDMLKASKLGRVIMGLYKNPKEKFSNREISRKLIHQWARPIFGLDSDYSAMSREERVDADLRHMVKNRKRRRKTEDDVKPEGDKPGDKNFVMRARVPKPSNTDYVIRPRSKIDDDVVKRPVKVAPKIDKLNKQMATKKKLNNPRNLRTSSVCLTGNKMPL